MTLTFFPSPTPRTAIGGGYKKPTKTFQNAPGIKIKRNNTTRKSPSRSNKK